MRGNFFTLIFLLILLMTLGHPLNSETTKKQTLKVLKPMLAEVPPNIDGILDDEVWKSEPTVNDIFISYNPHYGDVIPKKTRIWIGYDPDNIYFAFYCHDSEPDKIKTSVTKRDNLWNDDWVGLALDALGNRQSLYELFVNPSGMQADMFNTPASGENSSPDWVWHSKGKIVKDGYVVEIKLPLKSIRYKSGENVELYIIFWRRISRLGISGSWPATEPGKGFINSTAKVIFGKLCKQLKLEFLPSITYSSIWDRENPNKWSKPDDHIDLGLSAKYGITSSITAELTVNPDFSQVESDEFQVFTNRRYPIFYSEKRPFFMEAGDLFDLAGPGENMLTTVHTRKIVDPAWGARLTGALGKSSFGFLAAGDEWAGREFEGDEVNPLQGENANFLIGRWKIPFGGDSYIGALYTGREHGDQYNRTIGIDITYRFWGSHCLEANYIYSFSRDEEGGRKYEGGALSMEYNYSKRSFYGELVFEYFDKDFKMDTAFYNRTGIYSVEAFLSPRLFPNKKKMYWYHRIAPYIYIDYLHDTVTKMDDMFFMIGVESNFTKQAYFSLNYRIIDNESWQGITFKKGGIGGSSGIQLNKWLNLHLCFDIDRQIYYDIENPFLGDRFRIHIAANIQPNDKLTQYFSYGFTGFDRHSNNEKVYDYHIFLSRTTYQFNRYLFIRALIQYDSFRKMMLSDILASFTLIPGTVLHIGYGSLHEKLQWNAIDKLWNRDNDMGHYYQTSQSFFLKASYLITF